jgi:hypothetical protein
MSVARPIGERITSCEQVTGDIPFLYRGISMNVVDLIKDQLSGDVLGNLSSLLGKDQATTSKAVTGAVPAILSVLAGLAKNSVGIEKLLSALHTFDASSVADVVSALRSGNAGPIQQKGGDLLGSLLGGETLSMLLSALSKFSNLDSGSSKTLLSTLLPLVLGVISSHFKGKPLDSQSLSGFFKDQAGNIGAALPSGLSLADIPGYSAVKAAATESAPGFPSWLLPLVTVAILGLLGWYFLGQPPREPAPAVETIPVDAAKPADVANRAAVSEIAELTDQLSKVYTSAIEDLTSVKDVPTAEAAAPKLERLSGTIDSLKPLIDRLPESGKSAIAAIQTKYFDRLKDLVEKVLSIPGVGEKLKPIVDGLMTKLTGIK